MKQLVIESSNLNDTPSEIEEMLQKAVSTLQSQRENRPIKDPFLQEQIKIRDEMFHKVMNNMVSELKEVIK